ncbi:MAG: sulfatase [Mailhella sp.]|nr:sulfatase [Mailhella sp.]
MIKNAIVLMFDSWQFNYTGCYGNEWIKTPNIDRLAREGVLFENAYTEGLPTVPCRRAMHTGRFTLPFAGWVPLSMQDTTIADLCWGRPIDTALIEDCPMYRLPKFGYSRGFDKVWFTHGHEADDTFYESDPLIHYDPKDYYDEKSYADYAASTGELAAKITVDELANYLKQRQGQKGEKDRYVAKTMTKAIEYLEQVDRNKQFFLWIDSFDPHEPWDPPSVYKFREDGTYDPDMKCPYDPDYKGKDEFLPFCGMVNEFYTEPQLHHIRMLYAELVTLCDKYLGVLMDAIRRLGFEENTLFFVVSDHGEPLGNGADGHGLMRKVRPWPYEELSHIIMIIRAPGIKAGQRIKAFTQSVDVAPTVCDWLGIGVHPSMQGKSLLPLMRGEVDKVYDFAISGYYPYSWSIYTEEWSFIHWLDNNSDMAFEFYGGHIDDTGTIRGTKENPHSAGVWGGTGIKSEAEKRYQENASLDGADQWTCTPTSTTEVPDSDELYDRIKDPFQLHNVISEYPEIAAQLLNQVRAYIRDLTNS